MLRKMYITVCCVVMCATAALAQTPSVEELRGDFAKGDYRGTLRKIYSAIKDTSDDDYCYDLLMLRGECFIGLNDRDGAVTAYSAAIKHASDLRRHAMARANRVLLQRSPMCKFTPDGKEPIALTTEAARKEAMALLLRQLEKDNKPKVISAMGSSSLPPLEAAFFGLADQASLEMATEGRPDDTFAEAKKLADRAWSLMQQEINRSKKRIRQLGFLACSGYGGDGPRGVFSKERDELKDIAGTLEQIRDRAVSYLSVARKLEKTGQRWETMISDATEASVDARTLAGQQF